MSIAGIAKDKLEEAVKAVLVESTAAGEELTKKAVRRKVEAKFGLNEGALDEAKAEIKDMVEVQIAKMNEDGSDDDDSDDDDSDDAGGGSAAAASPAKPAAKKATTSKATPSKRKRADADSSDAPKKAKMTVKTVTGAEAPKGAKAAQLDAMNGADFLATAPNLKLNVFGNELEGEPREFSSGKYGWYVGGKIEVEMDGKMLWGQVGCNLVMIGSEGW